MDAPGRDRLRKLAFIPVLAIGVIALLVFRAMRAEPKKVDLSETGRRVRVIELAPVRVIPRATGYGVVKAREEWQMVAEVSGRVVEISPELKEGAFVKKGTTLIKVDALDYKLAEVQITANLDGIRAQIHELRVQEANARASLKIEQRSAQLARKEFGRAKDLAAQGALSQTEVDNQERNVLAQDKAVQNLRNTLKQLPATRKVREADLKRQEAGLAGASRDIARTELLAPYDLRIREVKTALQEVVGTGQVLAVADGLDVAEIPAQFSIGELRPLLPFRPENTPLSIDALSRLPELMGLAATVRLDASDMHAQWTATFDRFTAVDPTTRTVGVVVTISDPYRAARPGKQPPVVAGMYIEVELSGRAVENCLAVPRAALHGSVLYIAAQDRLARREVEIDFRQAEYVCIASGVTAGDKIILTDLIPAIEGMLLDPIPDPEVEQRLREPPAPPTPAPPAARAPESPEGDTK